MRSVPLAIPVVWTCAQAFFLQVAMFVREIGGDCLRHRRLVR
jgi:hypothetical protein